MATISLEGMAFYAHHGCFAEEQRVGTQFVVDIRLTADIQRAQETDDIGQTVDYAAVYEVVKAEMQRTSHLIEHVAHRIAQGTLRQFRQVQSVEVKVSKLNPSLSGQVQKSSVVITVNR